jgi:hypothetical protein
MQPGSAPPHLRTSAANCRRSERGPSNRRGIQPHRDISVPTIWEITALGLRCSRGGPGCSRAYGPVRVPSRKGTEGRDDQASSGHVGSGGRSCRLNRGPNDDGPPASPGRFPLVSRGPRRRGRARRRPQLRGAARAASRAHRRGRGRGRGMTTLGLSRGFAPWARRAKTGYRLCRPGGLRPSACRRHRGRPLAHLPELPILRRRDGGRSRAVRLRGAFSASLPSQRPQHQRLEPPHVLRSTIGTDFPIRAESYAAGGRFSVLVPLRS